VKYDTAIYNKARQIFQQQRESRKNSTKKK
jgi:hypothetical protein